MARFCYTALDLGGNRLGGTVEAPNKASALELLRDKYDVVVRLDPIVEKLPLLQRWLGTGGTVTPTELQVLIKRLSTLLCRSIREVDLTCHVAVHTFGIILQDLSPEAGEKLATTIRNAIANSRFRIEESGPEVLITASLGFSTLKETDTVDLVLNRAQGALQRSERVGRNQLHVHDGAALVHATCP